MSFVRVVYMRDEPLFPASDQHPQAQRYTVWSAFLGRDVVADATGGEPTSAEVDAVLNPLSVRVAAIDAARDTALAAGVTHDGKQWHIDPTFQSHITGLVAAFEAGIIPAQATVPIRTRSGTTETLNYTQIKALAGAVLARVQQVWAESWAAKDAL